MSMDTFASLNMILSYKSAFVLCQTLLQCLIPLCHPCVTHQISVATATIAVMTASHNARQSTSLSIVQSACSVLGDFLQTTALTNTLSKVNRSIKVSACETCPASTPPSAAPVLLWHTTYLTPNTACAGQHANEQQGYSPAV